MDLNRILLFPVFILLSSTVFSQNQITGKVIDSNEPLEGVSIYFEGTTVGTISDVNGEFSIRKPENNSTLIFSYLGFVDQKVEVTTQDVVNMTMVPDSESLDEIVVIGYGSQVKNDITGSVSVVNVEEIAKTYSASLTDQLQGRVAGVNGLLRACGQGYGMRASGREEIGGADGLLRGGARAEEIRLRLLVLDKKFYLLTLCLFIVCKTV